MLVLKKEIIKNYHFHYNKKMEETIIKVEGLQGSLPTSLAGGVIGAREIEHFLKTS